MKPLLHQYLVYKVSAFSFHETQLPVRHSSSRGYAPVQSQLGECATKQSCTRDFDGPLQVCWGGDFKIVNIELALSIKVQKTQGKDPSSIDTKTDI